MLGLKIENPYPDLDCLGETVEGGPKHVWIEPTTRCNTRCAHCAHFYRQFGEDMRAEVVDQILGSALDAVELAELTGYGEPFLAPRFDEMFEECRRRGILISVITNGILLRDEARAAKLVRSNVILHLSIDGARAETFEFVRPFIKWEKMVETLECLKRNAEAAGPERRYRLRFIFVPMKKNIADLSDMIGLAAQYGAECVIAQPLSLEGAYELMNGQSLRDSPDLVSPAFVNALRAAARRRVGLIVPSSFRGLILDGAQRGRGLRGKAMRLARALALAPNYVRRHGLRRAMQVVRFGFGPRSKAGKTFCLEPWRSAFFSQDGKVRPCCVVLEEFGNLSRQDWKEIWNGARYRNLRRAIHGWNPTAECRRCHLPTGINGGDEEQRRKFFARFRRQSLPIDSPLLRFGEGFYDLERRPDGSPSHRWMSRRGFLAVAGKKNARFLRLLIEPRLRDPDTFNGGWCAINGGRPQPFDNTCSEITFPLHGARARSLDVGIEMEKTFRIGPDPRDLSLALRGLEWLA